MAFTLGINASFLRKPDTGIGQVTQHVLRTLAQFQKEHPLGKELRIILYVDGSPEVRTRWQDQFLIRSFLPRYRRDDLVRKLWWEKHLLPKRVAQDKCDLFLSLYQSATIFPSNVRHIMVAHDTIWRVFPEYLNNIRKKIYYHFVEKAMQQVSGIMAVSAHSRKDVLHFIFGIDDTVNIKGFEAMQQKVVYSYIDCDPLFKQPLPADSDRVLARYGIDPGQRYLFYVGGFDIRKNIDRLLEAYGRMYRRVSEKTQIMPGIKHQEALPSLVLAGTFYPQLVPLVTDIPRVVDATLEQYDIPPEKIKVIGFVSQTDLPVLYHQAIGFCYLSQYEGFGLPPLEAMNMDCPVILSNAASLGEIYPRSAVLSVDPTNVEQVTQSMMRLLADTTVAQSLIQNGRLCAQRFRWVLFVDDLLEQLFQEQIDWAKPSPFTHE